MSDSESDPLRVSVRVLAMRDVLARLLAYEAERLADPAPMFEEISHAAAAKLRAGAAREPDANDPAIVAFQEMLQREVDELIGMARRLAEEGRSR